MNTAKELVDALRTSLPAVLDIGESIDGKLAGDRAFFSRYGQFVAPREARAAAFEEFNYFLAEDLLRDGCMLLDRALRERTDVRVLATRLFEAKLQIDELFQLNDILGDEEEAVLSAIEADDRLADAEQKLAAALAASAKAAMDAVDRTKQSEPQVVQQAKIGAFAAAAKPHRDELLGWPDDAIPNRYIWQHLTDSAEFLARHDLSVQRSTLEARGADVSGNAASSALRTESLRLLADYRRQIGLGVQRRRANLSRELAARRAKAFADEGGPLNFDEQLTPLQRQYENDVQIAWIRLVAAAKGLSTLYAYDEPLPALRTDGRVDVDPVVLWCQNANAWLAAFQQRQQVATRSLSLRDLLNSSGFEDGRGALRWSFELDWNRCYQGRFVRVRGIAVQVMSTATTGSWNVAITPPAVSQVDRGKGIEVLEQPHVGTLHIGRVAPQSYPVQPEAAIAPKLQNIGPVGMWEIALLGPSTSGAGPETIDDVELHLQLAFL